MYIIFANIKYNYIKNDLNEISKSNIEMFIDFIKIDSVEYFNRKKYLELKKEQATASRRQDRASSHSKAKEAHETALENYNSSWWQSKVFNPPKTPKTPMDTPQTRRGGKRRKRTLKKNR